MMKLLLGCFTWNAIWWGENFKRLLLVTFNSTVKKWPFLLYPNRSGVPNKLVFSILVQEIFGVDFLISRQNLVSFLINFQRNYFVIVSF